MNNEFITASRNKFTHNLDSKDKKKDHLVKATNHWIIWLDILFFSKNWYIAKNSELLDMLCLLIYGNRYADLILKKGG